MRQIIRLLFAESKKNEVKNPLTFTAEQANSTVKLTKSGSLTVSGLQYRQSISGDWTPYTIDTVITLANIGDVVQFQNTEQTLSTSTSNYVNFVMTGLISASGNIQSMLNYIEQCKTYCYYNMFYNCGSLASAPELPATTLANYCYAYMFRDCGSLASAPELPATTLANSCYAHMFQGCTSFTTAPELPATTLANSCYAYMFYNCGSLASAPELPATTLANYCYSNIFQNCTSLASAPELPAINLAYGCYAYMFYGCTSLTSAPELLATTIAINCYQCMFQGCTSLTSAPELPATTLVEACYQQMFYGCTSLTTAPELPATTLARMCYYYMFYNCTSLTAAPELLPAITLESKCYYSMFRSCYSLTAAPELPAATLVSNCYYQMFYGCTKLASIKVGFTNWLNDATTSWVNGVANAGTFEAPQELPIIFGISNMPKNWDLPNHAYVISTEDQKISQNYQQTVDYTIQYMLFPEILQPIFTIVQGELPDGLILDNATGVISGNLTAEFVGDVKIQISAEGCESVIITLSLILHNYQETENNLTANDSNPNYTVSQRTTSSSYSAWKAMDGNTATYSKTQYASGQYDWWQIDFHKSVFLIGFTLNCNNESSYGTYLEASENGTTWIRIDSTKIPDNTTTTREYTFTTPYRYYRFISEKTNYYIQFYQVKFKYKE